jgi:hypothetical protein
MKMLKRPKKELRSGDLVTVRAFPEIALTLDGSGTLNGMPFLPEMLKYCGQTFPVWRRVNKLMQEGVDSGMRRIRELVLLEGPTCDGRSHGDCRRACFPLWKTAWLKPADEKPEIRPDRLRGAGNKRSYESEANLPIGRTCQVTELRKATAPLLLWDPRRYYWDITSRTYKTGEYLSCILGGIYRKTLKRIIVKVVRKKPTAKPSIPIENLNLQPGELVEVKAADEIHASLDEHGKTRGLYFMPEMWEYCGRRLRVLHPIERMMSEKTGEIRNLNQSVILEGAICTGKAHSGCQRICYVFWKDTWLRRVDPPEREDPDCRPAH